MLVCCASGSTSSSSNKSKLLPLRKLPSWGHHRLLCLCQQTALYVFDMLHPSCRLLMTPHRINRFHYTRSLDDLVLLSVVRFLSALLAYAYGLGQRQQRYNAFLYSLSCFTVAYMVSIQLAPACHLVAWLPQSNMAWAQKAIVHVTISFKCLLHKALPALKDVLEFRTYYEVLLC